MEVSYNELRCKEVVNLTNGARMGKIIDLIIDSNGKDVLGLVLPGERKLFRANEDIFVPWCNISKIGSDVIFISLNVNAVTNVINKKGKDKNCAMECDTDFID